jgi:hypothetical protein
VWNLRATAWCGGTGVSYAAWWTPKKDNDNDNFYVLNTLTSVGRS